MCGVRWLAYCITTWMWSVVACVLYYHLYVSVVVHALNYHLIWPPLYLLPSSDPWRAWQHHVMVHGLVGGCNTVVTELLPQQQCRVAPDIWSPHPCALLCNVHSKRLFIMERWSIFCTQTFQFAAQVSHGYGVWLVQWILDKVCSSEYYSETFQWALDDQTHPFSTQENVMPLSGGCGMWNGEYIVH